MEKGMARLLLPILDDHPGKKALLAATLHAVPFLLKHYYVRKKANQKVDRLSELPDDVSRLVVSLLMAHDLASLSMSSTRWRALCASSLTPVQLHFDSNSITRCENKPLRPTLSDDDDDDEDDPYLKDLRGPCTCTPYSKDRLLRAVDKCAKLCKFSELKAFGVTFCLGKELTPELDSCILFALSKGAEKLIIHLSCDEKPPTYGTYVFRSELLSFSSSYSSKVTYMSLRSCIPERGLFNRLPGLKELNLVACGLHERDVHTILSRCLRLEFLGLERCILPPKLRISSSSSPSDDGVRLQLKSLTVHVCEGIEEMQVTAPNLTCLSYSGDVIQFSFLRASNLKRVNLIENNRTGDGEQSYNYHQLFNNFIPLELDHLCVAPASDHWVHGITTDSIIFSMLKRMELRFTPEDLSFHVQGLLTILQTCHLLEELIVFAKFYKGKGTTKVAPHVHNKLKKVELSDLCHIWEEVELVKYLLKCGVALEKMIIHLGIPVYAKHYDRASAFNRVPQRLACPDFEDKVKTIRGFLQHSIKPGADDILYFKH